MRSRRTAGQVRSRRGVADQGFTLVEAMVALAILGLAVVASLEISALTLQTQTAARRHLEAVSLADSRLNELAVLSADSLEVYAAGRSGEIVLDQRRYEWRAMVQPQQTRGLWRAAVVVQWDDGELAVETMFYRRGRPLRRVGGL